jgi:hypothetical protein
MTDKPEGQRSVSKRQPLKPVVGEPHQPGDRFIEENIIWGSDLTPYPQDPPKPIEK